jgi:hypothetical protein
MIILIVILAILSLVIYAVKTEGWDCFIGALFMGTLFSTFIWGPALIISAEYPVEVSREDRQYQIYSIRNNDNISGSFFLGSGRINEVEHYYMFAKNERGGFIRSKIQVNNAALYEDSNSPYVFYQKVTYRFNKWVCLIPFTWEENTSYDIHVPANTIIEKYEVK